MSHDRGCPCGREKWEYDSCNRRDCYKKPRKAKQVEEMATPAVERYNFTDAIAKRDELRNKNRNDALENARLSLVRRRESLVSELHGLESSIVEAIRNAIAVDQFFAEVPISLELLMQINDESIDSMRFELKSYDPEVSPLQIENPLPKIKERLALHGITLHSSDFAFSAPSYKRKIPAPKSPRSGLFSDHYYLIMTWENLQ